MDELKFAQFENICKLPCEQRLQFLKTADINYCYQDQSNLTQYTKYYDGSTYLHRAVHHLVCTDCVKQLLNRGVDLLKKTTVDERTPLLEAVKSSYKNSYIWHSMGKLENKIANILLSAQIETGNTLNPKDKEGLSHFHVACIFNHTEAVNFFLEAGESVNQAIDDKKTYVPGYTALHLAIKYSSVETVRILVDYNADIFLRNADGKSSLHLLVQRLMDLNDYMTMGKRSCCSFFKAEMERIEKIICFILKGKKASEMNFSDDTGLMAFHMACALSDESLVESFLEQSINFNAPINDDADFWPGYTPLHFAACFNVETMKLLLHRGADINKTADGKTPLDLCMERYSPEVIHSILSCKLEFENALLSDGSTSLLDVLLLMNDCDKFNHFLQNSKNINLSVPQDSSVWPGNTLLHLAIMINERTLTLEDRLDEYGKCTSTDSSPESYNCAEGDELTYWKRIVICLVRGCSLMTKNADGLTPIHLAFKLHKGNAVDKFLNSCKSDFADPSNLTHFHVACAIGKKSLVERLLGEGVDVNSPARSSFEWWGKPRITRKTPYLVSVRANSTPLHLAVIFEHIGIVELLLQHGADVYAQDSLGLTPIHLSIALASNTNTVARILLSSTADIEEIITDQGLTHLHVAAFVNDAKAVDKLVGAGSDVDAVFAIPEPKNEFGSEREYGEFSFLVCIAGETPLYVAMRSESVDAARSLIRAGADVFKSPISRYAKVSPFASALFEQYTDRRHADSVLRRIKREFKHETGSIEETGFTSLHLACVTFDLMWAKDLLKKGVDVNARIRDCKDGLWNGETPLHVLLHQIRWVETVPKNLSNLVRLLLKHGADVTIEDARSDTPVYAAYRNARSDSGDPLLASVRDLLSRSQKSYDVNPTVCYGFSHFHVACASDNVEIVRRFLDNGIDVDLPVSYFVPGLRDAGFTPLHIAFDRRHVDLARLLIESGANVKAEASDGNTPLHVAVMKNCVDFEVLDMLYRNGADFNAKNLRDMTPLVCLFTLQNFTLEQLDFFLKRDCKFDVTHFRSSEGILGLTLKNAAPSDRSSIFNKLLKTGDCKTAIGNRFNAIRSIVSVNHNGVLPAKFYDEAISSFIHEGCNLDEKDDEGRTPLHDAIFFYNVEAVVSLLSFGTRTIGDLKSVKTTADASIKPERKAQLERVLDGHEWMIKFFKSSLKKSLEENVASLNEIEIPKFVNRSQCQEELKKMEHIRISDSLTVQKIRHKGDSLYLFMVPECDSVHLKNIMKIKQEFPIFCGYFNVLYRGAV